MQSNYEEAKTYSSPHKNKDWCSCCLLLLALLALGLIVASKYRSMQPPSTHGDGVMTAGMSILGRDYLKMGIVL